MQPFSRHRCWQWLPTSFVPHNVQEPPRLTPTGVQRTIRGVLKRSTFVSAWVDFQLSRMCTRCMQIKFKMQPVAVYTPLTILTSKAEYSGVCQLAGSWGMGTMSPSFFWVKVDNCPALVPRRTCTIHITPLGPWLGLFGNAWDSWCKFEWYWMLKSILFWEVDPCWLRYKLWVSIVLYMVCYWFTFSYTIYINIYIYIYINIWVSI